jgi:hypothetical protein
MRQMKWIVVAMGCLLAAGSFDGALAVDAQRQAYDKMVEEAAEKVESHEIHSVLGKPWWSDCLHVSESARTAAYRQVYCSHAAEKP